MLAAVFGFIWDMAWELFELLNRPLYLVFGAVSFVFRWLVETNPFLGLGIVGAAGYAMWRTIRLMRH